MWLSGFWTVLTQFTHKYLYFVLKILCLVESVEYEPAHGGLVKTICPLNSKMFNHHTVLQQQMFCILCLC